MTHKKIKKLKKLQYFNRVRDKMMKKKSKKEIKKQYFNGVRDKYKNGRLLRDQLNKLPYKKKEEYLYKELVIKFDNTIQYRSIHRCIHCATSLLYDDGYVSDTHLSVYRYRNTT